MLAIVPLLAKCDVAFVTNVFFRAHEVYAVGDASPISVFHDAVGGGILQACDRDRFFTFVHFVSNNCDRIIADWGAYETNRVARFTTQCAIGFMGFEAQTNLADKVLSMYEADVNAVSWDTMQMIRHPDGPPDICNYLALHYDNPCVSNIIMRLRAIAVQRSDSELVDDCDMLLTGQPKRAYLDMKDAGAL